MYTSSRYVLTKSPDPPRALARLSSSIKAWAQRNMALSAATCPFKVQGLGYRVRGFLLRVSVCVCV